MKLSNKQKVALEKNTGKPWDSWHPEATEAYFSFTDKGQLVVVSNEAKDDMFELMHNHKHHAYDVETWKVDFRKGLLYLFDFLTPENDYENWERLGCPSEIPTFMYPDAYIKHAFEIYEGEMGYIPACYREHPNCPSQYRISTKSEVNDKGIANLLGLWSTRTRIKRRLRFNNGFD